MDRRTFLRSTALLAGFTALGGGSFVMSGCGAPGSPGGGPIRVGVLTDITGPLAFQGQANANAAKLAIQEINDAGGLLDRQLELRLEDSASNEATGVSKARQLVERDDVDVVFGGLTSSMRNAIKDPIVNRGGKLYVYPQLYEGGECAPYIYCTGPTPNQQVTPSVAWLMENGGDRFYLPAADYVWPRTVNPLVRKQVSEAGGEVVGEEYFPIDATDYAAVVRKIISSRANVAFITVIPPGIAPLLEQLYNAGFTENGGTLACLYFDENFLTTAPPEHVEGAVSCLDYFQDVDDPFSNRLQDSYDKRFGKDGAPFTAGTGATGMYRGVRLWEAAVREAGSVERDAVAEALDEAKTQEAPGGPAEMVPGERHARMDMYLATVRDGRFKVEENLGMTDPKTCGGGSS